MFARLSPCNRFSSSVRVSTPLRRSRPARLSRPTRLASSRIDDPPVVMPKVGPSGEQAVKDGWSNLFVRDRSSTRYAVTPKCKPLAHDGKTCALRRRYRERPSARSAFEQHAGQKFTAGQFISAYLSLLTRLRGPDQSKTAPLARFGAYEVMATARSHIGGNSEPRCGSSMLATGWTTRAGAPAVPKTFLLLSNRDAMPGFMDALRAAHATVNC